MKEPFLALGIVLAAIALLRMVLRAGRARGLGGTRLMRIEASWALGPRQRLHVVEVDGERLLVGATDQSIQLLHRLSARDVVPTRSREASSGGGTEGDRSALPTKRFRLRLVPSLGRLSSIFAPALVMLLLAASTASAQSGATDPTLAALAAGVQGAAAPERISSTLEILALLTLLSVAPSILLIGTCFTRVLIVLALLRQALGVQQLPPNQVLVGLALTITLFVMAPLGRTIEREALDPYVEQTIAADVAFERAGSAVRTFLLRYTREKDLALFVSLSEAAPLEKPEDASFLTLLPAYVISELRAAFEIGFTIFLPFLVIDLVIASMLISMQMLVLPPVLISLPFKLMLFVLVDGWNLIVSSLVTGLGAGAAS